jgi:hypothetical protein
MATGSTAMLRRAAQTTPLSTLRISCQASAEHFQQCAESPLLRNRGLGSLAVTVLPNPATTSNATWAGPLARATVSQTVVEMASVSAAANLIAAGMKLTFDSYATVRAPGRLVDSSDAGTWVSEGAPISLRIQRITPGATLRS